VRDNAGYGVKFDQPMNDRQNENLALHVSGYSPVYYTGFVDNDWGINLSTDACILGNTGITGFATAPTNPLTDITSPSYATWFYRTVQANDTSTASVGQTASCPPTQWPRSPAPPLSGFTGFIPHYTGP
jgi:hypothetical protein